MLPTPPFLSLRRLPPPLLPRARRHPPQPVVVVSASSSRSRGRARSLASSLWRGRLFLSIRLSFFLVPSPFVRVVSFALALVRGPSVFVFDVTLLPRVPAKLIVSPLSGNLYVNRLESVESHAYV